MYLVSLACFINEGGPLPLSNKNIFICPSGVLE